MSIYFSFEENEVSGKLWRILYTYVFQRWRQAAEERAETWLTNRYWRHLPDRGIEYVGSGQMYAFLVIRIVPIGDSNDYRKDKSWEFVLFIEIMSPEDETYPT